jgi:hypothetical protein
MEFWNAPSSDKPEYLTILPMLNTGDELAYGPDSNK